MNKIKNGILYIVPTPIGNLSDITYRALKILKEVDIIAAENIQHTNVLLKNFKIQNFLISMNQHNECQKSDYLVQELKKGKNIAIVSNAGTPVINDPGYFLIKKCHFFNIKTVPLPGACAAITALIASGIPANKFCYEGFLPYKKKARCNLLFSLRKEERTIIFYESKHRILKSIEDIIEQIDKNRHIVIAKEMTKKWESIYGDTAEKIFLWIKNNDYRYKGEIVIIIDGFKKEKIKTICQKEIDTFIMLRKHVSLKNAVSITNKIHNTNKNKLYKYAVQIEEKMTNRLI